MIANYINRSFRGGDNAPSLLILALKGNDLHVKIILYNIANKNTYIYIGV
jgi:hypothetical protein